MRQTVPVSVAGPYPLSVWLVAQDTAAGGVPRSGASARRGRSCADAIRRDRTRPDARRQSLACLCRWLDVQLGHPNRPRRAILPDRRLRTLDERGLLDERHLPGAMCFEARLIEQVVADPNGNAPPPVVAAPAPTPDPPAETPAPPPSPSPTPKPAPTPVKLTSRPAVAPTPFTPVTSKTTTSTSSLVAAINRPLSSSYAEAPH